MNELTKLTNNISKINRSELAKEVLETFAVITPQFYKNKSDEELQAYKYSIELLTADIEQSVLAIMLKLAIKNYALERSRNSNTYLDINYVLTFYEKAFNWFWCESVKVDYKCNCVASNFNPYTSILTEIWEREGVEFTVKYIVPKEAINYQREKTYEHNLFRGEERWYSPKHQEAFENMIYDPNFTN